MPSHNHSFSGYTSTSREHHHSISIESATKSGGNGTYKGFTGSNATAYTNFAGAHSHSFSGTTGSTGSGSQFSVQNTYTKICFIMKL